MIDIKTITKMEIDCFKFLEELRQSGITNMYGAVPYIEDWFKDPGSSSSRSTCDKIMAALGIPDILLARP